MNELEKMQNILKKENYQLCKITCCFSGHRAQSLPWGFNEKDERCKKMKSRLKKEIISAINSGYSTFICGMALGFDTICAEMVLKLKKNYPHI